MIRTFENIERGKNIYFASDFHLGTPDYTSSIKREKKIVKWLSEIAPQAAAIFLVGDIFDFWFEYKHTIPKGYARLQGKLAELVDSGIPITIFTGNHDMWMFDYFSNEFGIAVKHQSETYLIGGVLFFIGHGDGVGPGDHAYKFYKKIFSNRFCQWLFGWLHPNIGMSIAKYWSKKSRITNEGKNIDPEAEWLIKYCRKKEDQDHHDYYIFGHRHLAVEVDLHEKSRYINLGEWIQECTYAVFNGNIVELKKYEE